MEPDRLVEEMRRLGRQRDRARARAFQLTRDLAPLLIEAHRRGTPITEIAKASGLSRAAIYTILDAQSGEPTG